MLLACFAKEFGSSQPDEFPTRRHEARQFHESDTSLFERSDVVLGSDSRGYHVVQMRCMAKNKSDGKFFIFCEFTKELQGLGTGKQQI